MSEPSNHLPTWADLGLTLEEARRAEALVGGTLDAAIAAARTYPGGHLLMWAVFGMTYYGWREGEGTDDPLARVVHERAVGDAAKYVMKSAAMLPRGDVWVEGQRQISERRERLITELGDRIEEALRLAAERDQRDDDDNNAGEQ